MICPMLAISAFDYLLTMQVLSLTMSNESKMLIENHMNNELIKVDEWLKTNKLSLNCECMTKLNFW